MTADYHQPPGDSNIRSSWQHHAAHLIVMELKEPIVAYIAATNLESHLIVDFPVR